MAAHGSGLVPVLARVCCEVEVITWISATAAPVTIAATSTRWSRTSGIARADQVERTDLCVAHRILGVHDHGL